MKLYVLHSSVLLFISCFAFCSDPIAGGTETTNGYVEITVVGNQFSVKGKSGTIIGIFDSSYCPFATGQFADSITIGLSGEAMHKGLADGTYTINIWDMATHQVAIVHGIHIPTTPSPYRHEVPLQKTGMVEGNVIYNASTIERAYAYISGTPYYEIVDENRSFTLDGIPSGEQTVLVKYWQKDPMGSQFKNATVSVPTLIFDGKTTVIDSIELDTIE